VCAIDAETLETRVIKVTGRRIGDASMHPDLPDQIAGNQPIGLVTAAGAYDTRACHAAIAPRGAAAVIPPPAITAWKQQSAGAAKRYDALHGCRRFGRTIWKRWTGCHRRSLVVAKMRCFMLFGQRVKSRDFDRQVAELQIRAAILNRVKP